MNNERVRLFEVLSRLPARVWIQAILALIIFVVLAVLGFAVIAGVAAVALVLLLGFKAKNWILNLFRKEPPHEPPARQDRKVIDVQYEIVDRHNDRTPRN
jgi:hypothetical protein